MILSTGIIVDGRYQILEQVSAGGMGTVYSAIEIELNRKVALKFLHENLLSDPESLARFNREAELLSRLNHPNIATIFRYGCLQLPDSQGTPFIVMEFVEGKALRTLLQTQRLPIDIALYIVAQICNAIAHAHACGVLHRDLKPDNVMLSEVADTNKGFTVKIIDFGLGKIFAPELAQQSGKATLTEMGLLIGSVQYMSPEQCSGQRADNRSDIYSTGCMLYETLTGATPFNADSPMGVLYKHGNEPPPKLPLLGQPKVTASLQAIIDKALAKHAGDRYQSIAALGNDVLSVYEGREVLGPPKRRKQKLADNLNRAHWCAAPILMLAVIAGGVHMSNSNVAPLLRNTEKDASYFEERVKRAQARLTAATTEDRSQLAEILIKYICDLQDIYWKNKEYDKVFALDKQTLFAAKFVADPHSEFISTFATRSTRYRNLARLEQNQDQKLQYYKRANQALELARTHYSGASLPEKIGLLSQTVIDFVENHQYDRAIKDIATIDSLLSNELRWRKLNAKLDYSLKVMFASVKTSMPPNTISDEGLRLYCDLLLKLANLSEATANETSAMKRKATKLLTKRLTNMPASDSKRRLEAILRSAQAENVINVAEAPKRSTSKKSTPDQMNNILERHVFIYSRGNEERSE